MEVVRIHASVGDRLHLILHARLIRAVTVIIAATVVTGLNCRLALGNLFCHALVQRLTDRDARERRIDRTAGVVRHLRVVRKLNVRISQAVAHRKALDGNVRACACIVLLPDLVHDIRHVVTAVRLADHIETVGKVLWKLPDKVLQKCPHILANLVFGADIATCGEAGAWRLIHPHNVAVGVPRVRVEFGVLATVDHVARTILHQQCQLR
mmetsp:Transcript_57349/g.95305  ORF Transcript_57349/g.95305 Transcript_57349/m.95305 type:complete len:210 (+) Transcript_57349:671-1300(+)